MGIAGKTVLCGDNKKNRCVALGTIRWSLVSHAWTRTHMAHPTMWSETRVVAELHFNASMSFHKASSSSWRSALDTDSCSLALRSSVVACQDSSPTTPLLLCWRNYQRATSQPFFSLSLFLYIRSKLQGCVVRSVVPHSSVILNNYLWRFN